ncbi:MAG: U32 family peptidase C-terminal domain-containing protein [Patescibacteria group bacterium]
MKKLPELLAPAGSLKKVEVALAYGADAIYCGIPDFSLRARENEFSLTDLRKARALTHSAKKKLYLTINTYPRAGELKKLESFLKHVRSIKPDAIIFSDPGVLRLLKKNLPKVKLHLSVQANTVNPESVRFWYAQGVRRVILARELSLREITEIHKKVPRIELECFVHGAICMSYSGRCLLSLYLTNRDANRGLCTQPCRWHYKLGSRFQVLGSRSPSLEEEKRKGEYFPLEEDSHGSYILNSKDLCLIEKIPQLMRAGVSAFKIEGRHKSVGYLATITRAYRKALDDFVVGNKFDRKLWKEIYSTGNREFTLGFFDGSQKDLQNYTRSGSENTQSFLGLVEEKKDNSFLLEPKNRFQKGDKIEAVIPHGGALSARVKNIFSENFKKMRTAHGGPKEKVWIELGIKNLPEFTLIRKC